MSDTLRDKLSAVRRKSVMVNTGAGACLALGVLLAALGAGMLIDWLWEMPYLLRAAFLAIDLAMLATLILREVIGPLLHKPDEDEVALWVEQGSPGLRSRLISAIQLTRAESAGAASISLVSALVRETEELTAPMDFLAVVKVDRLVRFGGLAALAVVLGLATMAMGGRSSADLLKRALLVPGVEVPRKTRVKVLSPDPLFVARGEPVELRAQAAGIIPAEGQAQIHYDTDKRSVGIKMTADADHREQFFAKMETVADSFTYRVFLNDGHSIDCRVEASVRPSVAAMEIDQVFPPYTHLKPARRAPGDLRLLAGSRLAIRVTANKPVKQTDEHARPFNRVTLHGKAGTIDYPLVVSGTDRRTLAVREPDTAASDIPLAMDTVGLSVHLVDDNGLETRDPAVYRIEQISDAPPTVRITFPDRREQLSTAQAQLELGVEAADDFSLGKLALRYKVLPPDSADTLSDQTNGATAPNTANPQSIPVEEIPFELKGNPAQFRGRFNFQLNKLKTIPLERGGVEWWLEAQDTNAITGPGKAASEHYLTRIGSEAEVRADLFVQLGNHMGQIKEQAETLKQDNAELGEMIQEKVGDK